MSPVQLSPPKVMQEPRCPRCGIPAFLPAAWSGRATCGGCRLDYEAATFSPATLTTTVRRIEEADAPPCAAHAGNAATATCQRCGTFACDLCRVDQEGMTLCVACFDRLTAEGALATTRNKERNWGGIASLFNVGSFVTGCGMYLGWVLGPLAAWAAWRGLKQRAANGETQGRVGLVVTGLLGLIFAVVSLVFLGIIVFGIGSALLTSAPGVKP
jgi:ribosomal protein S27AE